MLRLHSMMDSADINIETFYSWSTVYIRGTLACNGPVHLKACASILNSMNAKLSQRPNCILYDYFIPDTFETFCITTASRFSPSLIVLLALSRTSGAKSQVVNMHHHRLLVHQYSKDGCTNLSISCWNWVTYEDCVSHGHHDYSVECCA